MFRCNSLAGQAATGPASNTDRGELGNDCNSQLSRTLMSHHQVVAASSPRVRVMRNLRFPSDFGFGFSAPKTIAKRQNLSSLDRFGSFLMQWSILNETFV